MTHAAGCMKIRFLMHLSAAMHLNPFSIGPVEISQLDETKHKKVTHCYFFVLNFYLFLKRLFAFGSMLLFYLVFCFLFKDYY